MLNSKVSIILLPCQDSANKNRFDRKNIKALFNNPIIQNLIIIGNSGPEKPRLNDRLYYVPNIATAITVTQGEYICFVGELVPNLTEIISTLYNAKQPSMVIVGNRYSNSEFAKNTPISRQIQHQFVARLLSIPIKDIFSPYVLFERSILANLQLSEINRGLLIELLTKSLIQGYQIIEKDIPIPPHYHKFCRDHTKVINFKLLYKLWIIRNSIESADYDHRAHYSIIPPQRYWQRQRYKHILQFLGKDKRKTLDIGCGSSNIIQSIPNGVALDIAMNKLRFLKKTNQYRVLASTFALPFENDSFRHIIHSQVIEHVPESRDLFLELDRVLEPRGTLIIGTPDYGRIWWPIIEFFYGKLLPNAYADEHITHYTMKKLRGYIEPMGYILVSYKYILGGELIMKFVKEKQDG